MSLDRVINVTASFDPMENGLRTHPMNPEIFVGRCLFQQNHGFNPTVTAESWHGNLGVNPPGNVFDPRFELLESPWNCTEFWMCPARDREDVTMGHS